MASSRSVEQHMIGILQRFPKQFPDIAGAAYAINLMSQMSRHQSGATGSRAMLTAIRRASSFVSTFACRASSSLSRE
jgi:hypothetical protein